MGSLSQTYGLLFLIAASLKLLQASHGSDIEGIKIEKNPPPGMVFDCHWEAQNPAGYWERVVVQSRPAWEQHGVDEYVIAEQTRWVPSESIRQGKTVPIPNIERNLRIECLIRNQHGQISVWTAALIVKQHVIDIPDQSNGQSPIRTTSNGKPEVEDVPGLESSEGSEEGDTDEDFDNEQFRDHPVYERLNEHSSPI